MKAVHILFVALLALTIPALAQPDSLWSRTYGGTGWEYFASLVQTEDGGYVVADNMSRANQGFNAWIVRTNALGDTLWCREIGGWGWEGILDIGCASDGGYYGIGSTHSSGPPGGNAWLVELDADGNVLWTRPYGGPLDDWAYSGQQTFDGGYILGATTSSFGHPGTQDFWLIKTNANGDSVWSRTFGGSQNDGGYNVIQTADGGYMFVGQTCSFGDPDGDFWLIKTNANGDSLWSRTYGGPGTDYPWCVRQTQDSGYIVTGAIRRSDGFTDAWLLKTDASGDSVWSAIYGVPNDSKVGFSVIQTDDGGYAVAGGRQWNTGSGLGDGWIFRTDSVGNFLWQHTFGGPAEDAIWDLAQTADGGYALAGYTYSFGAGSADGWLIKTGPDPVSTDNHPWFQPSSFDLSSYPNPFNSSTTIAYDLPKTGHISLRVYDLLGCEVTVLKDGMTEAGNHRVMFDGSHVASGIYFARMEAGEFTQTKKLMLLK